MLNDWVNNQLLVVLASFFLIYSFGNLDLNDMLVACATSEWMVEPHLTFLFPWLSTVAGGMKTKASCILRALSLDISYFSICCCLGKCLIAFLTKETFIRLFPLLTCVFS